MEDDIIIVSDEVEIHPGRHGGYSVVRDGSVYGTYATLRDARALAKELARKRGRAGRNPSTARAARGVTLRNMASVTIRRLPGGAVAVTGRKLGGTGRANPSEKFNVYLRGRLIDSVYQTPGDSAADVKRSLVNHDGYDPAIVVKRARKPAKR